MLQRIRGFALRRSISAVGIGLAATVVAAAIFGEPDCSTHWFSRSRLSPNVRSLINSFSKRLSSR